MARVLIIEDSEQFGSAIERALKDDEHDTVWVQDAYAAKQHLRNAESFDFILLDYYLSTHGPTGHDIARYLARRCPDFAGTVICMSSDGTCNARVSDFLDEQGIGNRMVRHKEHSAEVVNELAGKAEGTAP